MKFGYSLRSTVSIFEIPPLVQIAERSRFSTVWFPDSQLRHSMGDVYAILALCATKTDRLFLGTGVTNPFTRHTTVTANAIRTIDELSHGRAILGMGAGDASIRPLGQRPWSASQCETVVKQIRALLNGEEVVIDGTRVKTDNLRNHTPPIYLAASGPLMLRAAGRVADGVILNVGVDKNLVSQAIASVRGASEKFSEKDKEICCLVTFCISEDRKRALDLVKPYLGYFQTFHPKLLEKAGASITEIEKLSNAGTKRARDLMHSEDYESAARETSSIPDELAAKFALGGTPEDIVRKARELETMGVNEILLRPFFTHKFVGPEGDQEKILKTLGESVISDFA